MTGYRKPLAVLAFLINASLPFLLGRLMSAHSVAELVVAVGWYWITYEALERIWGWASQ